MRFVDYFALFVIGALLAGVVASRRHASGENRHVQTLAAPSFVQELPDAVVNAPAQRLPGPDGYPLLDHSEGW
jgi:hypothetical protein